VSGGTPFAEAEGVPFPYTGMHVGFFPIDRRKTMDEDKARQRKLRRIVYMMAGAYILYQAYSMITEWKSGAVIDRPALLAGAIAVFIVAGLGIVIYNGLKLKKEFQDGKQEEEGRGED